MKNNHYVFIFLLITIFSCQNKKETIQETKPLSINDFPKSNIDQNFVGVYQGILPCADCEGMETILVINENNTFTKSVHYLGKGNKVFEQKGNFSWNTLGNVIQLNDIENAPNQYLVTNSKLVQLDLEGKIIAGNLAKEYEFTKQPEAIVAIETSQPKAETVNLNNKLASSASIEKVNPAEGKYTLARTKWKLIHLNGKTVKQIGNKSYFIKMNSSDGRFSAFAGCNNIMGNYAMPKTSNISFFDIAATQMFCEGDLIENDFIRMLEETTKYVLENETLSFYSSGKKPIATFVAIK